jgi:hypothetical protein
MDMLETAIFFVVGSPSNRAKAAREHPGECDWMLSLKPVFFYHLLSIGINSFSMCPIVYPFIKVDMIKMKFIHKLLLTKRI